MEKQGIECCDILTKPEQMNLSAIVKDYEQWIEKLGSIAESLKFHKGQFYVLHKNTLVQPILEKLNSEELDIWQRIKLYQQVTHNIKQSSQRATEQLMEIHNLVQCDFCRFSKRIQEILKFKEDIFKLELVPLISGAN